MKLEKGMMLDFFKLGHGLIVHIGEYYESKLVPNSVPPANRMILTNRYECNVLIQGTLYEMSIIIHYGIPPDHMSRSEWRVLNQGLFAKSGLAEVLWYNAKIL